MLGLLALRCDLLLAPRCLPVLRQRRVPIHV
jgi:hypothetical protein